MIRLSRPELIEIAHTLVLANTPLSLLKGLRRSSAMDKLRKLSSVELRDYYDHLTARPGQSEITVALAYAVLIAILLQGQDGGHVPVDPSRIHWGEYIHAYLSKSNTSTQYITPFNSIPAPTMKSSSSPGASMLFGPDDRPLGEGRKA